MTTSTKHLPRGGHGPSYLRDAFCALLESMADGYRPRLDDTLRPEDLEMFVDERNWTVRRLLGRLWNCTDILPGVWRDEIDELAGRPTMGTYAAAARVVHEALRSSRTQQ